MKKKLLIGFAILSMLGLSGCSPQKLAKNYGGTMNIELDPGVKLEQITWKDDSLWYLTRPMREDDIAEIHTFQQSSGWGVFEGKVVIVEKN